MRTQWDNLLAAAVPLLLLASVLLSRVSSPDPLLLFLNGLLTGIMITTSVIVVWRWSTTSARKSG